LKLLRHRKPRKTIANKKRKTEERKFIRFERSRNQAE
jgi:hypothetical protein